MTALSIVVAVLGGLTALLGLYYALRDLNADLVLLGACVLLTGAWAVLGLALGLRDLGGGAPPDRITLYGYLLTALVLATGGGWPRLVERSRWGTPAAALAPLLRAVALIGLSAVW